MSKIATTFSCVIAALALGIGALVTTAEAYPQYSGGLGGGCIDCHGDFRASNYTPLAPARQGVVWTAGLHNSHRSASPNNFLNSNCDACHSGNDTYPVLLGLSNAAAPFNQACTGCHDGPGTRNHHMGSQIYLQQVTGDTCADCHGAEPIGNEKTPLPPVYTASLGTTSGTTRINNPCNDGAEGTVFEGSFFDVLTVGLDNDGDGLYDQDDPDCQQQQANQPPQAADDAYSTDEDTVLTVAAPGVLGNDTDPDGDPLAAVLVTDAAHGTLELDPDGAVTYAPDENFSGTDTFTYQANDGQADSNTATVTITVNPVNDAPVADPNGPYNEMVGQAVSFDGSGSTDVDGTIVSYAWDFGDGGTGTGVSATHTYASAGTFTVTLTVTDNGGATDTDTTTAVIADVANVPPEAADDSYSTDEDTPLNVAAPGVLGNDTDDDSDPLTARRVTDVSNGLLTLNADGSFNYAPNPNFFGTDSFTYVANDGLADSNAATVTITVNPVNDPPVSGPNGPYMGNVGSPVAFDGSGSSDVDGTIASYAWDFGDGGIGTGVNPTHSYGANGTFTVTLTVTDNGGLTDTATTTAVISGEGNTPPVAADDEYSADEDTPLAVAAPGVLGNDSDPDGGSLTAVVNSAAGNGTLTLTAEGAFTYAPNANFCGTDSFTYVANDGQADSNIAAVTITVNCVNDPPIAVDDAYTTASDTPLNVAAPGVLGNDTDVDGDPLTAHLVSDVSSGSLTPNEDGSFTYNPGTGFAGTDSFTYVANDGADDSNAATVTITVQPASGLDLDIAKFRVTKKVNLRKSKPVEIKLVVRNRSTGNGTEERPATVVGEQNGVEVYNETVQVSDAAGDGRRSFDFPSYTPVAAGDIRWTATIADDDPDLDMAMRITEVEGREAQVENTRHEKPTGADRREIHQSRR